MASNIDREGAKVFFSYAHEDEALRDELAKHLKLMERQGIISTWHDREIAAGSEWAEEIDSNLECADIILLLISSDFLASDYCWDLEMLRAIERHEMGEALVIPIILRAVEWEASPFAKLQALPKDGRPVRSWADSDEAFKNIASEIRSIIGNSPISEENAEGSELRTRADAEEFPLNDLPRTSIKLIGRESETSTLYELLQEANRSTVAVITGMPGVGKTELALQYAWTYGKNYLGGVCWVDAREDDIAAQIVQFAQTKLGLVPPTEGDLNWQLNYCLRNWPSPSEKVLIIVDDIDSYETQLESCLKGVPSRFVFLLTSRQRFDASLASVALDPLTEAQGVAIFKSLLGQDARLKDEHAVLVRLCNWLGCLPLAIQLVGNYLALDSFASIDETYQELQRNSLDDVALENEESNVKKGAKAAFELSWQQLSFDAKHLGYFLSLFAPAPIPWDLVTKATKNSKSVCNLRLARLKLIRAHLLKQVDRQNVQVHRLLREFFRSKAQEIDFELVLGSGICEALVPIAQEIPDKPLYKDLAAFTDVYLHIEEVVDHLKAFMTDGDAIAFFKSLMRYYSGRGRYKKAQYWAKRRLDFSIEKFGQQHQQTALSYREVGLISFLQGKLDDALANLKTAMKVQKPLSGEDSLEVAAIQVLFAVVYRTLGDFESASQAATAALITRENFLDTDDLDVAEAKMTLATIRFGQNQTLETVKESVSQVLAVRREKLPPDHSDFPETLNLLAKVYEKQKCFKEAEDLYVEAKEFNERILGCTHPQTAFSYNNLAKIYQIQKQYEKAKSLFQKSVDILKESEILPAAGWCLRNLAVLYSEMQELVHARTLLQEAIDILESCLPSEHPYIKQCKNDLQGT